MKKIFLIFGLAGVFYMTNGYATQSSVVVTYSCPDGCELKFSTGTNGSTHAYCETPEGKTCADPAVNVYNATVSDVVQQLTSSTKTKLKKEKLTSARSAETPKMMKKIVYEVVTDEE